MLPVYGIRPDGSCMCNDPACDENRGKHPIFDAWPTMATANRGTIQRWWRVWNGLCNFGWKMGTQFVALDLDRKHGNDGIATLHQLEAEHGPLPRSLSASTPTGGGHIAFRIPEGLRLKATPKWRPGIDIRAGNSYIVIEPSITPNGQYRWWAFDEPAVPPQWLLDILPRADDELAADGFDAIVDEGAELPDPARRLLGRSVTFRQIWDRTRRKEGDDTDSAWDCTLLMAYLMGRREADDQELTDLLAAYRDRWGGWGSHHKTDYAARTIRAARGRMTPEPQETVVVVASDPPPPLPVASGPVLPTFPLEVLPPAAAALVDGMAASWRVDPALYAVPALAVLSIAVGASSLLHLPAGQTASSALWTAIVAPTGSGKTPAAAGVLRPVREYEREIHRQYQRDLQRHQELQQGGKVTDKPRRELLTVGDVTWEILVRRLAENPLGLLWIRDEILALFGSLDAYKPNGKGFADQDILSTWSGEPIRRLRQKDDEVTLVDRPWLGLFGGIQPALLQKLGNNASGRLSRLLAWSVDRRVPEESEEVDSSLAESWAELVLAMLRSRRSYGDPDRVQLSQEAKSVWKHEQKWRREQMLEADDDRRALLAKLDQHAGRLALVLWAGHSKSAVGLLDIDGWTMEAAWQLAKAFYAHQAALFVSDEDWVNPNQRAAFDAAAKFHEWLVGRGGRMTLRDVQRATPPGGRDAGRLHALIAHWEECGYGRVVAEKVEGRPGPPTRWLVCREAGENGS